MLPPEPEVVEDPGDVGTPRSERDRRDAEGHHRGGDETGAAAEGAERVGSQRMDEATEGSGDEHMRNMNVRFVLAIVFLRNELVPDIGGSKAPAKGAKRALPPEQRTAGSPGRRVLETEGRPSISRVDRETDEWAEGAGVAADGRDAATGGRSWERPGWQPRRGPCAGGGCRGSDCF